VQVAADGIKDHAIGVPACLGRQLPVQAELVQLGRVLPAGDHTPLDWFLNLHYPKLWDSNDAASGSPSHCCIGKTAISRMGMEYLNILHNHKFEDAEQPPDPLLAFTQGSCVQQHEERATTSQSIIQADS
jgi:hypothetical protein